MPWGHGLRRLACPQTQPEIHAKPCSLRYLAAALPVACLTVHCQSGLDKCEDYGGDSAQYNDQLELGIASLRRFTGGGSTDRSLSSQDAPNRVICRAESAATDGST